MSKSGRRPGATTTRAALLAAARRRFAEAGYDAISLRQVAADAGVDPAVVIHFFGSKEGLFQAAVGWPFDPAMVAERIGGPGAEDLGGRIARVFLEIWEDPAMRAALLALLRSAATQPAAAALLREYLVQQIFGRVGDQVAGQQAELRVNLAAAQMIGIAVLRYILEVEPLASAGTDDLVAWLTPALGHYLAAGPADEAHTPPP